MTPYLGQLRILRDLLEAVQITTSLDERDLEDLDAEEAGSDNSNGQIESESKNILQPHAEQRSLETQVLLRIVDRFQGKEADIIVLSLVRNARTSSESAEDGDEDQAFFSRDARASIGFLKSPNRTNVAVSRAKHGLYLFGNASLFRSKAPIWESIIHNLEKDGNVGPFLPATCAGHPEKPLHVDGPGQLPQLAPFGGCLDPCTCTLPCGHRCPQVCHPIDSQVSVSALQSLGDALGGTDLYSDCSIVTYNVSRRARSSWTAATRATAYACKPAILALRRL